MTDHAARVRRGLKGSVSDHAAVGPSERRGRIDSRDAAEGRTMQWVRPRGRTGGHTIIAVEMCMIP